MTPSASGSAYLEWSSNAFSPASTLSTLANPSLKLICMVHGPRPLPRSAPFAPDIILTANVKYSPFSMRQRRGYLRDAKERDLSMHLETALRGVVISDRWPKSGLEVAVTILEGEEDYSWRDECENSRNTEPTSAGQWSVMSVLSGCITVASAAIADARIDCVDVVAGGFAALVRNRFDPDQKQKASDMLTLVLDPTPLECHEILAACVVGYLPSRDEITALWVRGELGSSVGDGASREMYLYEDLTNNAIQAAIGSHRVLTVAVKEAAELKLR